MSQSLIPADNRYHVVLCHMDDEGMPGELLLGQEPLSSHDEMETAVNWLQRAMTDPTHDTSGGFETTLDLMHKGRFVEHYEM